MRISAWSSDVCSSDLGTTAALAAALTSSAQASLGAFADQITLELRYGAEEVEHQQSPRRGVVDVLGERTEPDAAGCQFADLVEEVAHRAAEPSEFPHDQLVAGAQISQCFGKPVPVGPGTRCLIVENTFASRAPQGVMLER